MLTYTGCPSCDDRCREKAMFFTVSLSLMMVLDTVLG
jgi:hypothetical protein